MMLCCRLEKRRQAMLEMPQMIQTWKEASLSPFQIHDILLTITCSEVMAVDGRSGPNERSHFEDWTWLQSRRLESLYKHYNGYFLHGMRRWKYATMMLNVQTHLPRLRESMNVVTFYVPLTSPSSCVGNESGRKFPQPSLLTFTTSVLFN